MSVQLKLRIKLPWGEEKIIPFEGREMSIGRGSDCQIKVDDPEVSREHALIRYISPEKLKMAKEVLNLILLIINPIFAPPPIPLPVLFISFS